LLFDLLISNRRNIIIHCIEYIKNKERTFNPCDLASLENEKERRYDRKKRKRTAINVYLFFDTETTGLPLSWNAALSDLDNWPRLVQIAWQRYDGKGAKVSEGDYIIYPEGFTIPKDASRVHGISTARARQEGTSLNKVLEEFSGMINASRYLVAHNMGFDEKIVGAEFLRQRIGNSLFQRERLCTMRASTEFCQMPGNYGYKWPKLAELYRILFDEDFREAHNAAVDIEACAKCFWELRRRGIM
jgi:DNA polymerase III epsilon subunit-like protein